MKTISKRFLKGGLALLLAFVMLFGTTLTGFAAVVDNADTSANVDVAETNADFSNFNVIFDNTNSKWSSVYFFVGHNTWSQPYQMTKISNTGNLYALTNFNWGGATQYCFATGLSGWGGEGSNLSNRTGYCTNSSIKTIGSTDVSDVFFYAYAASGSDNATTTAAATSSGYSYFNKTQTAKIYSTPYGSSTYTEDTSAGSVAYSTYRLNGNSSTTSSTGTNSANAAKTATVKMTATASAGYTFKGWTTTQGGAPTVTTNPYSYTCTGATTYYACFEKAPTYAVTYDANGGTGAPAAVSGIASGGSHTVSSTVPTQAGKDFVNWNTKSDGSGTAYASGATISNITANITLYAQWKDSGYTYTASASEGGSVTPTGGTATSATIKATPATGYEFVEWVATNATLTKTSTDANGIATGVFTISANGATIKAVFQKKQYTITATAETGGSVSGSGTYEYNSDVTLSATPSNGYAFAGWYKGGTKVSDNASYSFKATETAEYVAKFTKLYKLTLDITEGVKALTVEGNQYTTDTTLEFMSGKNVIVYFTAAENYRFASWSDGTTTQPLYVNMTQDVTVSANTIQLKQVSVIGATATGTGMYGVGDEVTLNITCPDGKYLNSATSEPAHTLNVNKDNSTITFTMPDEAIAVTPVFADYSYVKFDKTSGLKLTGYKDGYKAGEAVSIKVESANTATTISNVVADEPAVVTNNNDGTFTITVASMPANKTINVVTTVDTKYVMDYSMTAIGNYGTGVTSGFGTVSMKIGSTTLAKGGYAAPTDTVTYTAQESNANYAFAGFYSDPECKNVLSYDSEYTVKPKADTTVYTLWARRQYMDFDSGSASYVKELVYNKEKGVYTLTTVLADSSSTSAISKGAWFQVTNDKNSWTTEPSYHHFGSDFTVTHNGNSFDATITWNDGGDSWKLSTSRSNGESITFILTPTGNTAIDFSAQVGEVGDMLYLSAGRVDLQTGDYSSSVFDADTTLIESDIDLSDKKFTEHNGAKREAYRTGIVTEPQNITFQTVISGTSATNYVVDSFVVYHINSGSYEVVTPNQINSTTFQGTVYVDGPCFVCPIYFITDEYAEANGLANIDIFFDVSGIQNLKWGPFVACYAWGTNGADYLGSWSGQMMIPTEDGKSFYTQLTVPAVDAEKPASVPNGVTFNNYMQATVPGGHAAAFGISSTQYQCYDYREPLTLYEQGYEVISFVVKDSKDGYHGDRYDNSSNHNPVTSSTTDIFNKFEFDYLYNRDGNVPMDFNGNEIEDYADLSTEKADYYVVSRGDIGYDPNGNKYSGDNSFDADWAVDWYIFDSNGKHLATVLSTALYHDHDEDGTTILLEALDLTKEEADGKTVAISYEKRNNAGHQTSYDGQWYGNMLDHTVTGQVKVGFADDIKTNYASSELQIEDDETPHQATYGEGYVVNPDDGSYHQSLDITMDYGEIDLHAVRKDGYAFVGWYTQLADGSYKQLSKAFDYHTYINFKETYFAIFRNVAEGEVIINHSTYNNPNDPAIPSHGGMSQMSVKVTASDGTVYDCTPSTSRTNVSFPGDENLTYTVEITTTPLLNGEFFAWYTDSTNADGTKTYEEVFTREDTIGATGTVTATFTYKFSPTSQKVINIYSDVKRVSNTAMLQYKYFNRFENLLTYTVKDIPLSDEECLGCEGNGYNPYFPSYLTLYTFVDGSGKEYEAYEGTDNYYTYEAAGYSVVETYNKISAYAPKSDVTEVFDGTVQWIIDDAHLTTEKSLATLFATQDVPTYTINYTMPDHTLGKIVEDNITAIYNTLVNITAPTTDLEGKEFSYWYEPATGEILTYSLFYNYRIVEKKSIVAVYGVDDLQEWVPAINSVTITREFSDNSDYIYNDFLLAFNNTEAKEIETALSNGEVEETGLLVLRKDSSYISDAANVSYPDATDETTQTYLKRVANEKKKNMAIPVTHDSETTKYNCYYYNLENYDYTNLNRLNFFVQYDNKADIDGTHRYYECAYTAVAYIIVDGVVYLSNPKNVEFFELGKEAPTLN